MMTKLSKPLPQTQIDCTEVLLLPCLAWFMCEHSWASLAQCNRLMCGHLHSRGCLRTLAAAVPPLPAGVLPRRRLWRQLFLGALDLGSGGGKSLQAYRHLASQRGEADAEIQRDVGRTFPECFDMTSTEALFRVLRAVAHRMEDIGYCQGMNFIAGIILRVFGGGREEAMQALVYQCVLSMLLRHGMNQYFGEGFPKLRLSCLQLDCLVEAYMPDLSALFDGFNLSAEFYATQWFLTIFSYSLPFPHVLRIWDQFLCRGMKFVHRVALALLKEARPALLGASFDVAIQRLRCIGQHSELSPEALVRSALEFKVTNRLLSELEQAITAPRGRGASHSLPRCFLERNLDSGRTSCRIVSGLEGGDDPALRPDMLPDGLVFLEAALPAQRVPVDPVAPRLELAGRPDDFCKAMRSGPIPEGRLAGSSSSSGSSSKHRIRHGPHHR
ncbi:unnamed protein product, partial [Polarella glacialis]